jgi:hypothetical protein
MLDKAKWEAAPRQNMWKPYTWAAGEYQNFTVLIGIGSLDIFE